MEKKIKKTQGVKILVAEIEKEKKKKTKHRISGSLHGADTVS